MHDGDGPTGFKTSLLTYLKHYHLPHLRDWIKRVEETDFNQIRWAEVKLNQCFSLSNFFLQGYF